MPRGQVVTVARSAYLLSTVALAAAVLLTVASPALAVCTGPGAQTSEGGTPQTTCLTAIQIPGNPLRSFDISWVDQARGKYFLADRSNAGIDVISTYDLTFRRTITGGAASCLGCKFTGQVCTAGMPPVVVPCTTAIPVNTNLSGPNGVTSRGRWLYAGDGDSTLKVIDLSIAGPNAIVQSIPTGGSTRVDEMALNHRGTLLLAANNAEDPPFATLFNANGDNSTSNVSTIIRITVALTIIPKGVGLSLEQPAWEPSTGRFYTSIPVIAENPPGCNVDANAGPVT